MGPQFLYLLEWRGIPLSARQTIQRLSGFPFRILLLRYNVHKITYLLKCRLWFYRSGVVLGSCISRLLEGCLHCCSMDQALNSAIQQKSNTQFSHPVVSYSLQPHELQHARAPCPSLTPGAYPNPCPLSRWCHPTISSSVVPFSSGPQSFPASRSFPLSQLFTSGGWSIGVSASTSILPMNTQDWSPLGWTDWISLQSKGLLRVFSNTKFKSINSSVLSFVHSPPLTSIHDYWEKKK